jgi:hypothetical protein
MYGLAIDSQKKYMSVHEPSGCMYSFLSGTSTPNRVFCRTGQTSMSSKAVYLVNTWDTAKYGQVIEYDYLAAIREVSSNLNLILYNKSSVNSTAILYNSPITTNFSTPASLVTEYDIDWLTLPNSNIIVALGAKDLFSAQFSVSANTLSLSIPTQKQINLGATIETLKIAKSSLFS